MKRICEGSAKIAQNGRVFYNPVQEFNRDFSILALKTFAERKPLTVLEGLSASGLRAIRYL
jgi:tRNA G26 N,N-dimethylase Trm1